MKEVRSVVETDGIITTVGLLEFAEGECIELQECIEQQKMLLEKKEAKLQQKKRKLKDMADDLRKCKSRVLELEADKYFLAADKQ
jgi:hypothetical protein